MKDPARTSTRPFFVVGGTLAQDAPSYVRREADEELFRLLSGGEYCHVLTPRQMGKSSIMVRTAAELRAAGSVAILLDLTALGVNLSPEQWYRGQVRRMGRQLGKEEEIEAHWQAAAQRGLGAYQRWEAVLTEFLLPHCDSPVVIFIDEIDIVRSLPFSADEYFAGIRQLYNARAGNPALRRLTFCLLGVVTPFELIQDPRHTPFNVGKQIELRDFSEAEVTRSLAWGLVTPKRDAQAVARLLRRVLFWTGGQPYLTQRLCEQVAGDSGALRGRDVDRLCRLIFFGHADRVTADDHLLFVRERLLRGGADLAAVLTAYQEMLRRSAFSLRRVRGLEDAGEENPTTAALRLSGIARIGPEGTLLPRNRIYRTVFDARWAASQMPDAEGRRLKRAYRLGVVRALVASGTVTAAVGTLAAITLLANARARTAQAETRRQLFVADMNLAQRALEENNVTRTLQLLERHQDNPAEQDRFEWRYLWKQCHEAAVTLPVQEGGVAAVRFGKSASQLLTMGGENMAVRAFFMPDGVVRERLPGMELSRQDNEGRERGTLSPDATRGARCAGDRCELADVRSGTITGRFAVRKDSVRTLAFTPDNRRIAVGELFGAVTIRDARGGRIERTLATSGPPLKTVMFSPDGRRLVASASDGVLRLWDVGSGKMVWQAIVGGGNVRALGFSPNGRVMYVGGREGTLFHLDTASGRTVRTIVAHETQISAVAVSRQGDLFVTSGEDNTIRVWNAKAGASERLFRVENPATTLAISADGRWLVAGDKAGGTSVWRLRESDEAKAPITLPPPLGNILLSPPDGKFCAAMDRSGRLSLWEVLSRRPVFTTDTRVAYTLTGYSSDGRCLAAGNENGRAAVYDTATGRVLRTIAVKGYSVLSMALSSGGEWLATNDSSGAVEVWRTDTGERVSGCLIPEWDGAGLLTFAPNGKILVAASADGSALHIIRPRTGQISTLRGGHNGRINDVVFSNDGGHMATVGLDAVIRLWSLPNGLPAQPRTVSGHTGAIYTATFSPDGKSLLTGGYDGVIRVWDVATFQEVLALSGRWKRRPISSLQFDRSGATMLSTDADGTTRFWNGVATPRK